MKFVGRVNSICGTKMLIIECDAAQLPRLNTEVADRRLKPVGKLVEIFGNIKTPYAAVLCYKECKNISGEKLFTK